MIDNGNSYFLYNISNENIMAIQPELANLLVSHKNDVDVIKEIHPTFFEELLRRDSIVLSDINESQMLIDKWKEADTNPKIFSLIVLPTLDCNLRCWYCYEKHNAGSVMKVDILDRIKRLVEKRVASNELENLSISFFGGEPLMGYSKIVWPLLAHAKEKCDQYGKKLRIGFTTNGTLITKKVIEDLESLDCPINFQITLDGDKIRHDAVRHMRNGKSTYDLIVGNIKQLVRAAFIVSCRINYTHDNMGYLNDIAPSFGDLSKEEGEHLQFYLQQVWQEQAEYNMEKEEEAVIEHFRKCGLMTSVPSKHMKQRCYAESENCFVVSYNGDIYKCTAWDFTPERKEGVLQEDGTIKYNQVYKQRMEVKFGTEYCQACSIYPICHGAGCSQNKLERTKFDMKEGCLFNYSESDKHDLIQEHLKAAIELSIHSKSCIS